MIDQLSHLDQEALGALCDAIECNIESYENILYYNKVFRDLIHLSAEDISRLSPADIKQKDNIITELLEIVKYDDYSDLEQTMEYYQQDAENLIDKATNGKGVKY